MVTFVLSQDVTVWDFSNLSDARLLNIIDSFAFVYFHQFADAITINIKESEKKKYVLTQIIRTIIEEHLSPMGIMGIKYRSVKTIIFQILSCLQLDVLLIVCRCYLTLENRLPLS